MAKSQTIKLKKAHSAVMPGVGHFKGKAGETIAVPESLAKHLVGLDIAEEVAAPAPEAAPVAPAPKKK